MLVPPRVAACTVVGALTKLILHLSIPTVVWLLCIGFSMPGKRSYVNAVTGCMTQDQIRRQARDRAFLPQPPPPPLSEAPRHSAWADIVDRCDCATQCDHVFAAMPADPPLSGKFLDTINRALHLGLSNYNTALAQMLVLRRLKPNLSNLSGNCCLNRSLRTLAAHPVFRRWMMHPLR